MTLCERCNNLGISDALQSVQANRSDGNAPPPPQSIGDWHDCLHDINQTSGSCDLCALVMKGWRQHRPVIVKSNLMSGDIPPDDQPSDLHSDILVINQYRGGCIEVEFRCNSSDHDGGQQVQSFLEIKCLPTSRTSWDACDELSALFRIASGGASPSSLPLDVLVNPNPLSPHALQIPNEWLRVCNSKHKSCVAGTAQLPTRFLDIYNPDADSNSIVLRELKDSKDDGDDRYVALSHCWGRGQNFCTTKATIESHKSGIEISQLPQTFRDAVAVVRGLGLRYLWIDSLCIIQGDLHDWQVESANMATIYRDAYLVLGAARGESDAQGFLGSRQASDVVALGLSGGTGSLNLQLQPPETLRWTDGNIDPIKEEPLSKRAWCLQERYLSRRMLLYGSQQSFWECNGISASENGDMIRRDGDQLGQIAQTANIRDSVFLRSCEELPEGNAGVNHVDWYTMIEDYTNRGITAASDRLPALIGLVKATAQISNDEYLAGIWKSSMVEGLIWCGSKGAGTLANPTEYIAPSWSWASVTGPVQFPIYSWYDRAPWKARISDFEALVGYVDHTFQLRDLEPEGRLKNGHLRINAALLPITSIEPRQEEPPRLTQYFGQEPNRSPFADKVIGLQLKLPAGTTEMWVEGGFDKAPESGIDRRLFVILLTRLPFILESSFVDHRFGLVVEKVGATEEYRRVGFVDGCLLRKLHSGMLRRVMKWRHGHGVNDYGVAGFLHSPRDGDLQEGERPNVLAYDPLEIERTMVTLV